MFSEIPVLSESHIADVTLEWALSSVDSQMIEEVASLVESLITSLIRAL